MSSRLDDVFARTRELFDLPEGLVYLDGNSLGPLPRAVRDRVARVVDAEWGRQLIKGWNESAWIDLPRAVGDRVAALVGAPAGSVIAGDSTSVNLFKVLSSAVAIQAEDRPGRRVVLSDSGNFPTDLYVMQGLVRALGDGWEVRVVAPEAVVEAIDPSVAVLALTQVDYRTGRLHDMQDLTARAHATGALAVWDLAHSAGALPVELESAGADFAVGCGYKYLNGGPGAPAYLYVAAAHADRALPALAGWMGHEAPFAFDTDYRPAPGLDRMLVGTPPILSMAALHEALAVWEGVDLADVRARSIELSERFIAGVEASCPELELASPRDPLARGSQVSLRFEHGYSAMQALIANDVVGDFRAPDLMRFGFTPLYVGPDDIDRAVEVLARVMRDRLWDRDEYRQRARVT